MLDPGVLATVLANEIAPDVPVPSGRRRKPTTEPETPLPEASLPAPGGRRRRGAPAAEGPAAVLDRPAGRRRKAPETPAPSTPTNPAHAAPAPALGEAPLVELPDLQGVQAASPKLRFEAPVAFAPLEALHVVPEAPGRSLELTSPVAEALQPLLRSVGDVPDLDRPSHRKATASRRKPASAAATVARANHRRKPRKALLPGGLPGSPAVVAGAAAIAVAAVGVANIADQGSSADVAAAGVSQASAVKPGASVAQVERQVLSPQEVARERALRASRVRARAALAERKDVAAELKKKEDLALKTIAAARARTVRLAKLAKLFTLPVKDYRLTAGFGEHGRWSRGHTGLDFACDWGTPIRAVASGEIVSAKWDGAYGWKTVVRLPDGTENWYAHQSAFVIRKGHVDAGDVIGRVGSTGHSSGPHLHLEVRVDDEPVNPRTWLKARGLNP